MHSAMRLLIMQGPQTGSHPHRAHRAAVKSSPDKCIACHKLCSPHWPGSAAFRKTGTAQSRHQQCKATAGPGGWGSNSDDPAIRDAVRRLSRLFYNAGDQDAVGSSTMPAGPGTEGRGPSRPEVLRGLPLWRSPTAVLPGSQELLHVHAPAYIHMFDILFSSKPWLTSHAAQQAAETSSHDVAHLDGSPWRFGHIFTPGSHVTQAGQEPQLQPGSGAPLVGVLMEVTRAVRLTDGKLMLLASALGRFRVLRCVQASPYVTADVALYPDEEETRALHGMSLAAALEAADALQPPAMIEQVMAAADEAAHAAAGAVGLAWHAYEHHIPRSQAWPGSSPREGTGSSPAERTASSAGMLAALASAGILDCVPLPGGAVAGQWQHLQQVAARADVAAKEAAQKVVAGMLQAPADRTGTRVAAETSANSQETASMRQDLQGSNDIVQNEAQCDSWSWRLAGGAQGLNSVADRGVAVPWSSWPAAHQQQQQGSHRSIEQLERLVWEELDTLAVVTLKARHRALSLPLGLLQMRPPSPPASLPSSPADGSQASAGSGQQHVGHVGHWGAASEGLDVVAPQEWPVWRRAQRLSYALAGLCSEAAVPDDRQAFLELPSTCLRLEAALQLLQRQRGALATRLMLQDVAKGARVRDQGSASDRDSEPGNETRPT